MENQDDCAQVITASAGVHKATGGIWNAGMSFNFNRDRRDLKSLIMSKLFMHQKTADTIFASLPQMLLQVILNISKGTS